MSPRCRPVPPAPAPAPATIVLPEGTNFVVRMIDAVDSEKVTVGQNVQRRAG
jgi:hypothetical protein